MRTRGRTYPVSTTYIAFNTPVTRHNPISCSSTIGATNVTNTRNRRSFKLLPSVNLYLRRMPLPPGIRSYACLASSSVVERLLSFCRVESRTNDLSLRRRYSTPGRFRNSEIRNSFDSLT